MEQQERQFDPLRYLDPDGAADFLGCTRRALEDWRRREVGPEYIRVSSRMIRYRIGALIAFMDSRRVEPQPPVAPRPPTPSRSWKRKAS